MGKRYLQIISGMDTAFKIGFGLMLLSVVLSACSISEEIKRIEAVRQAERQQQAANSGELTGEQLFIRSCNTCHPGGKQGLGPALDKLSEHFPDDQTLKKYIRTGKGIMPPQPETVINDQELNNLVNYLHSMQD